MLAAVASTSLGLWIGLVAQAGAEDGGGGVDTVLTSPPSRYW